MTTVDSLLKDRDPEELLQEAEKLCLQEPSRAIEIAEYVESLLEGAETEGFFLRSLLIQGRSWYKLGRCDEAKENFTAALPWARQRDDPLSTGTSLYFLGLIALRDGEIPSALEWLFQARECQSASGDRHGEANTLCSIGAAYGTAGRYREAGEVFAEAIPLARLLEDRSAELSALGGAATLLESSGDLVQARTRYEEILALAIAHRLDAFVPQANSSLCRLLSELGETEKALGYGRESLRFAERRGNIFQRIGARKALALVFRKRGELEEAERCLHEAMTLAAGEQFVGTWTICLHELGRIAALRHDALLARSYFEAALQQATDEGSVSDQALQHRALADLCEQEGDLPAAIRHLRALVQAEEVVQRQSARGEFMAAMARLEWEKSQKEDAL